MTRSLPTFLLACLTVAFFFNAFTCSGRAQDDSSIQPIQQEHKLYDMQLKQARMDLDFVFDRVRFVEGHWQFHFSRNVQGQGYLWRMRASHTEVTGVCESGQVLDLPRQASLEIRRSELRIFFEPTSPITFHLYLTQDGDQSEITAMAPKPSGEGYSLALGTD